MTITDEMVEKAGRAYYYAKLHPPPDYGAMRAALEAVAPLLIAQGIAEAIKVYASRGADGMEWDYFGEAYNAMRARAQELDPQ